jgi:hypothetical protein
MMKCQRPEQVPAWPAHPSMLACLGHRQSPNVTLTLPLHPIRTCMHLEGLRDPVLFPFASHCYKDPVSS